MKNYAMFCVLAIMAILFAPQARADAAHDASALALMVDVDAFAMSVLPDDETLILSKQTKVPGLTCDFRAGRFVAYVVDGRLNTIRTGCFHTIEDGVQVEWQDGTTTDTPMADVIVNQSRDQPRISPRAAQPKVVPIPAQHSSGIARSCGYQDDPALCALAPDHLSAPVGKLAA